MEWSLAVEQAIVIDILGLELLLLLLFSGSFWERCVVINDVIVGSAVRRFRLPSLWGPRAMGRWWGLGWMSFGSVVSGWREIIRLCLSAGWPAVVFRSVIWREEVGGTGASLLA